MMANGLELKHVSKVFGDLEALRDITLHVAPGEFVAIVGPSGCGKTTMMRMIAGLESVDSGAISIDGKRITGPGPDRGFVFQADSLLPWMSVWKNTTLGLRINGTLNAETEAGAKELLALVGLTGFEDYWPGQLSGGMRQRVNLARALAINPSVLLMDEPFSALDAQTREIMQIELLRIWSVGKKTVLFITHQIDEAVLLSDRVAVLGRRPGVVKEIVTVDLPRPRALAMKRQPPFVAMVDRIWGLIEHDVMDSVRDDAMAAG